MLNYFNNPRMAEVVCKSYNTSSQFVRLGFKLTLTQASALLRFYLNQGA